MGEANTPTVIDVQKRVSEVIEQVTKLKVVSIDKLEGIDDLRPVFIVDTELTDQSPYMKNWADNEVMVDIYYFGQSTVDCKQMADTLNAVFVNPLKIGPVVVVPDAHNAQVSTLYVLQYTMTISYLTLIEADYIDITMGHIPHISDYNDDVMGEVYTNDDLLIKEEDDNGGN